MNIWDDEDGSYIELDVKRSLHEAAQQVEAVADESGYEPFQIAQWHLGLARRFDRAAIWRAIVDHLLLKHHCVTRRTRINIIDDAPGPKLRIHQPPRGRGSR
jgi:hypothetical protein